MGEKNGGAARATTKTRTAEKNGRPVRVFGYARVSSRDQNLARQVDALTAFGIDERSLFCDKASGKDFLRPSYQKLVHRMRPGDVLVVKSIDRLGRSYEDIIEEWRRLTKERGVSIVVLDMPLLDTRKGCGDLTGELIADIVLQLLSYVAQIERENIHQRQAEGIAAARERGVRFGRPRIERPAVYERVWAGFEAGELSGGDAARACGVSRATFARWVQADRAATRAGSTG